jgi:hypothetical protein
VRRTLRPFVVAVMDAEGVTHDYVFMARSRRHATRQAREWLPRSESATALAGIPPLVEIDDRSGTRGRRLLAVAGVTFAVSGVTITATMILALKLEGTL